MTFETFETSARSGRKVWLYVWQRGEKVYRWTSADRNLIVNFQTYTGSGGISHGDIEQGGEIIRQNVDVQVPMLHPVALLFRAQSPVDSVVLTISEYHADDPDTQVRAVWSGRVLGVKWNLPAARAEITHSPTYASLARIGLRRRCQKNCPLVLYGVGCGVNREAFKLTTTVGTISGFALTAAGLSSFFDGYWNGGYIEYLLEVGVKERRGIKGHTSGTIQLASAPIGLAASEAVDIFPGCDHTTGANGCGKLGNLPRYGGFPNFAEKNPFGGEPVY